ncbi:uncharacterized protein YALI1_C00874g [Yarrowia lipolytica]|uniref:Uncharacterized protein n=1 Tax=Yarrowia lipolytica TaxID=4952 RepID=A0A1D8N942_YARLL|nr:hypothetical protein YALI1_C00874g [Yarrowia lipolytica]
MTEEMIRCQYCGAKYSEKDFRVHIDACFLMLGRAKNGKINKWSDDLNNTLQMCDICKGYYPYKEFDTHIKACSEYYQKLKSVK